MAPSLLCMSLGGLIELTIRGMTGSPVALGPQGFRGVNYTCCPQCGYCPSVLLLELLLFLVLLLVIFMCVFLEALMLALVLSSVL